MVVGGPNLQSLQLTRAIASCQRRRFWRSVGSGSSLRSFHGRDPAVVREVHRIRLFSVARDATRRPFPKLLGVARIPTEGENRQEFCRVR